MGQEHEMTDEACDAYRNEHEERPTTDGVYLGRGRPLGLAACSLDVVEGLRCLSLMIFAPIGECVKPTHKALQDRGVQAVDDVLAVSLGFEHTGRFEGVQMGG